MARTFCGLDEVDCPKPSNRVTDVNLARLILRQEEGGTVGLKGQWNDLVFEFLDTAGLQFCIWQDEAQPHLGEIEQSVQPGNAVRYWRP